MVVLNKQCGSLGLRKLFDHHCLSASQTRWVDALFYSLLLFCLLRRPSIWLWRRLWRRQFGFKGCFDDLRIDQDLLKINCDSMSAIYLVKNQIYHVGTKHIDIRFHFVREILDKGDIELKKIHTKKNPTDMLTKVVSRVKFAHCKELLYMLSVTLVQWTSFGWTTDDLILRAGST